MNTMGDFNALSDEDLYDMGMVRCVCGQVAYPGGGRVRHCEQAKAAS